MKRFVFASFIQVFARFYFVSRGLQQYRVIVYLNFLGWTDQSDTANFDRPSNSFRFAKNSKRKLLNHCLETEGVTKRRKRWWKLFLSKNKYENCFFTRFDDKETFCDWMLFNERWEPANEVVWKKIEIHRSSICFVSLQDWTNFRVTIVEKIANVGDASAKSILLVAKLKMKKSMIIANRETKNVFQPDLIALSSSSIFATWPISVSCLWTEKRKFDSE